jgi:hypothetical protein
MDPAEYAFDPFFSKRQFSMVMSLFAPPVDGKAMWAAFPPPPAPLE